jgi:hypothetical protein
MKALTVVFAVTFVAVFAVTAQADRSRDAFDAVIDEFGIVTDAPDGPLTEWYYYENTDWWNVWFYDHPFELDYDKYIRVWLSVEEIGPDPELWLTVNWSTDAWIGQPGPPLPPLTPIEELMYIFRPGEEFVPVGGYYIYECRVSDFFSPPYNPEWVSVDIRGRNVRIIGWIEHICYDPYATRVECYSWENGGTLLGHYGNIVNEMNVSGPQTGPCGGCVGGSYTCPGASEGMHYLHVMERPHSGTPQAYVAWITNLAQGDIVDASFNGYDITPGASPSLRIWAHYTTSGDIEDYQGSAGGLDDYTAGTGWDPLEHTWTFDDGGGLRDALVIEARLYSTPSTSADSTSFWIDDICVTAPMTAVIHFPEPISAIEDASWGRIKSLYR